MAPPGTFPNTSFILSNIWNTKTENGNNCSLSFACFLRSRSAHTLCPSKTFCAHEFFISFLVTGPGLFLWKGRRLCHPVEEGTHDVSSVVPSASFFLGVLPPQGCVYRDVELLSRKKQQHLFSNSGRCTEMKRCFATFAHVFLLPAYIWVLQSHILRCWLLVARHHTNETLLRTIRP